MQYRTPTSLRRRSWNKALNAHLTAHGLDPSILTRCDRQIAFKNGQTAESVAARIIDDQHDALEAEAENPPVTDDADPGEADGDHESALASAGWGTDEDYGCYGSD